jgi:hypothetical protein
LNIPFYYKARYENKAYFKQSKVSEDEQGVKLSGGWRLFIGSSEQQLIDPLAMYRAIEVSILLFLRFSN